MRRVILVTGGQRSGKSSYAESRGVEISCDPHFFSIPNKPVYLATARVWDSEFAQRIQRHKDGRKERWENIECEKFLSECDLSGRVVVIDCVTLWATNFFFDMGEGASSDVTGSGSMDKNFVQNVLDALKREFDAFTSKDAIFIFVTNEIGMGEVSTNALQRKFTDLQGWFNQYIASKADEVILMVSGIPVKVK